MRKKSQEYHEEVKRRLRLGQILIQQRGHEPTLKVTQQDQAELDQAVFKHEVSRHVDKRGRKIR